jgi:hypothetical protein
MASDQIIRLGRVDYRDDRRLFGIRNEDRFSLQDAESDNGFALAPNRQPVLITIIQPRVAAVAGKQLAFWLMASLLLGAFAALAAVEGGQLRDGTWNDRVLTPRTI